MRARKEIDERSLSNILMKFKPFQKNKGGKEAQADVIAYILSDVEDHFNSIRMSVKKILSGRLSKTKVEDMLCDIEIDLRQINLVSKYSKYFKLLYKTKEF